MATTKMAAYSCVYSMQIIYSLADNKAWLREVCGSALP